MLVWRTLHEVSVYTHCVDNMAEGSAGVTWVVCACKQNDLPDGDNTLYTKHVILWQRRLPDYTTPGIWCVFDTVYTHRVDNMAAGSAGVTWLVCGCKQNGLPDGDNTSYTKHVILWQGRLSDYTTLGIWWVFETESGVNCGIKSWAVTKSRQDGRQQ